MKKLEAKFFYKNRVNLHTLPHDAGNGGQKAEINIVEKKVEQEGANEEC